MKFSMSYCNKNKQFFTSVEVKFSKTISKQKDEILTVLLQRMKSKIAKKSWILTKSHSGKAKSSI